MASRRKEDVHKQLLKKLLTDSGLTCVRSTPESTESTPSSGENEEFGLFEEEEEAAPEITVEEEKSEVIQEAHEDLLDIFPTPSLRKVLPDKLRKIEEQNRIHVLPEKFNTSVDPAAIPKIASTAQQKYIDILAEIVGCSKYKSSLAEFWFLDNLANLLRRAQEDRLDRPTQAVLILWFCEWMKEMQHFDAADRKRMIRRFEDNMLAAAKFVVEEERIPSPIDVGVYYKPPEERDKVRKVGGPFEAKHSVSFKDAAYECSLQDLTTIIHYIFDLFSTDYQYNLVRAVFTFTPGYVQIDAPYQIQNPKRLYESVKVTRPRKERSPKKDGKGKGKKVQEEDNEEFLALMELKEREERELEAKQEQEMEAWKRRTHILPLSFAADNDFFAKYWPPRPPRSDTMSELESDYKSKGKGKEKK